MDPERGGPDLYFRIDTVDGRILLHEDRACGTLPERKNVQSCFSTEFLTSAA